MKPLLLGFLLTVALSESTQAASRTLTELDNGKDLQVTTGDLLVFRLPSNRSTGYSWSVATSTRCRCLLGQVGKAGYELPKSAKGLVGVGGTEVWKFRALGAGSLTITFAYARPWEKGIPPVRTLSWPVTIRPSKK